MEDVMPSQFLAGFLTPEADEDTLEVDGKLARAVNDVSGLYTGITLRPTIWAITSNSAPSSLRHLH